MPVWFIDRHPMRVFKCIPDFDPFFESPIAAVWCNLIGLPIHLFEKSALFAIGGLLGEPLLVDHATITRSMLSFARLCIEIDISKTPVGEIVLDLQGKEVKQMVKWDRIPLYCQECKHVGHSRDVCYANGQKEKPARRNYKPVSGKGPRAEEGGLDFKGKGEGLDVSSMYMEMGDVSLNVGMVGLGLGSLDPRCGKGDGLDSMGPLEQEEGEFLVQSKQHGVQGKGAGYAEGLVKGPVGGRAKEDLVGAPKGVEGGEPPRNFSGNRFYVLSSLSRDPSKGSLGAPVRDSSSRPHYLKMLPNGDFDPEVYEDETDWDCETECEDESRLLLGRGVDKRGATMELSNEDVMDSRLKKGRLEVAVAAVV